MNNHRCMQKPPHPRIQKIHPPPQPRRKHSHIKPCSQRVSTHPQRQQDNRPQLAPHHEQQVPTSTQIPTTHPRTPQRRRRDRPNDLQHTQAGIQEHGRTLLRPRRTRPIRQETIRRLSTHPRIRSRHEGMNALRRNGRPQLRHR